MPLQATSGAASYDAFGGGVAAVPKYIEDYFYTYLRPAQGGSITYSLPSGVDLYNNGGIVWVKSRNAAQSHAVMNPNFKAAGGKSLQSNTTAAFDSYGTTEFAVNSNNSITMANGNINDGSYTYVDWTFVKTPKFFDVVTYTGDGTEPRNISHNLGSVPGCMIVKGTSAVSGWRTYHRSLGATKYVQLQSTNAAQTYPVFYDTAPTSTVFTVGTDINASGVTYVAYLFAHDAGGFGLTGTDNVISCGSYTGNGSASGPITTLGYEPQWVLIKRTDSASGGAWALFDNMRGLTVAGSQDPVLYPNSSDAEFTGVDILQPLATGFQLTGTNWNASGGTYIYIAIRRGPMKVPTVGTSVFDISTVSTSSGPVPGPTPTDMTLNKPSYNVSANDWRAVDRLRGGGLSLFPNTTGAESAENYVYFDYQSGLRLSSWPVNTTIWYNFRRAPSFFDEVCYTGTGSNPLVLNHNLGIAPTTIIIKRRSAAASNNNWYCGVNMNASTYTEILLNSDGGGAVYSYPNWFVSAPTSTTFDLNGGGNVNQSGATYVAYLFATCPGVSKVGTYTGNGTTQTIDCGFGAGGVRFVLIKRTDSTGDWYTYDTARGMTVLTDPYLFLNTTDAEVATLGSVTTVSTGFALNSSILAAINISAGTYTFLAIA